MSAGLIRPSEEASPERWTDLVEAPEMAFFESLHTARKGRGVGVLHGIPPLAQPLLFFRAMGLLKKGTGMLSA